MSRSVRTPMTFRCCDASDTIRYPTCFSRMTCAAAMRSSVGVTVTTPRLQTLPAFIGRAPALRYPGVILDSKSQADPDRHEVGRLRGLHPGEAGLDEEALPVSQGKVEPYPRVPGEPGRIVAGHHDLARHDVVIAVSEPRITEVIPERNRLGKGDAPVRDADAGHRKACDVGAERHLVLPIHVQIDDLAKSVVDLGLVDGLVGRDEPAGGIEATVIEVRQQGERRAEIRLPGEAPADGPAPVERAGDLTGRPDVAGIDVPVNVLLRAIVALVIALRR